MIHWETLRQYVQFRKEGKNPKSANIRFNGRLFFIVREEDLLKEYLIDASIIGFSVDGKTLRKSAYEFAVAKEKVYPSSWRESRLAGENWLGGVLKRHPHLSTTTLEATSVARATTFNRENVDNFFKKSQRDNLNRATPPPPPPPESYLQISTKLEFKHLKNN